MVSEQEKVQCVLWYHETKSPITVQRNFRRKYGRPPPDYKSIIAWNVKFKETGGVASRPRTGRPTVSEETVQAVQQAFVKNPSKSTRHMSRELGIPRSTVQKILHKLLHLVQTEMEKHEIVPDVIDKAPSKPVEVMYGDLKVDFGNELTPTQVQNKPTSITWDAESGSFYTLLMTDPDAPSRKNPTFREWHHWLVGNIPGTDVNKGETLSAYVGSGPPKGTGLHRYVYLVYKQPGNLTFDEERLTNTSGKNREKFSARKFASKHGLDLIAGNFYQAQHDEYCEKLYAKLKG